LSSLRRAKEEKIVPARKIMTKTAKIIYCHICSGGKQVPGYIYKWHDNEFSAVPNGTKDCPGCDGTGISEKARREMAALDLRSSDG